LINARTKKILRSTEISRTLNQDLSIHKPATRKARAIIRIKGKKIPMTEGTAVMAGLTKGEIIAMSRTRSKR